MTKTTFGVGGILVVLGIIAYIATGAASVTALIPAFIGVLLLICAAISRKESLHRHAMHAAMVVALLGALGSLMPLANIGSLLDGTAERPAAIITSLIMLVLLVILLVLGIRSFIAARRARSMS